MLPLSVLDKIQARREKATAAGWNIDVDGWVDDKLLLFGPEEVIIAELFPQEDDGDPADPDNFFPGITKEEQEANADFISWASEDIEDLLEDVRELRAIVCRMRDDEEVPEKWRKHILIAVGPAVDPPEGME